MLMGYSIHSWQMLGWFTIVLLICTSMCKYTIYIYMWIMTCCWYIYIVSYSYLGETKPCLSLDHRGNAMWTSLQPLGTAVCQLWDLKKWRNGWALKNIAWLIGYCKDLPSGRRLHHYQKQPFLMGKSTISKAMFNSYVSLPEGLLPGCFWLYTSP
jgi:hypothetical protein